MPDRPSQSTRSATFYPLYACNARCPFCSTRVYTENGIIARPDFGKPDPLDVAEQRYSLEEARGVLRQLRSDGVTFLDIQGGEPTLLDDLPALVEYAREIGFETVQIVTNGIRLRDRRYAERLAQSRPTGIAVSVFGATAAVHDESLGVPGAFAAIEQCIRNLLASDARPHVSANFVLHAFNHTQLTDMLTHFHALGLRYFTIRILRETENTRRDGRSWFFDLHAASASLRATVDLALELGDCTVTTSGVPYCLLGPRYLGFIARDLPQNAHLWGTSTIVGRTTHSESIPARGRHVREGVLRRALRFIAPGSTRPASAMKECRKCDLREVCLRVEDEYASYLSAPVEPFNVLSALDGALTETDRGPLRRLLTESADWLREQGVDDVRLERLAELDRANG